MKKRQQSSGWSVQARAMLANIDGPQDPETAAAEAEIPDWLRKLREISTETAWAALPMNRSWSEAKRLGCTVGREFVMRNWFLEQFENGPSPQIETLVRDAARDLEPDLGAGIADDMIQQLQMIPRDDKERNSALARILALAFSASVNESADFFDGFSAAVRKRADDDEVWASICLRASIYAVLENNWQVIPDQKPLPALCDFILRRIPARIERRVRRDEMVRRAFGENVRKVCNMVGLPTGKTGRPRKNSV